MQRFARCTVLLSTRFKFQSSINRNIRLTSVAWTLTRRGAFEKEALQIAEKVKDVQADYDKIFTHEEIIALRKVGKDREAFLLAIELYLSRHSVTRRGHVEFIEACMRNMEQFKVHRDLAIYKRLFDIFPPDELRAMTFWQFEFKHYPKQQDCAIDILEKMHFANVLPDDEVGRKLVRIFGRYSYAVKRFQRQLYWLPKFANADPYFVPDDLLAKYPFVDFAYIALAALRRANPDDNVELYLHRLGTDQQRGTAESSTSNSNTEKSDVSKPAGQGDSAFIAYSQSAEQRVILDQFSRFAHASLRNSSATTVKDQVKKQKEVSSQPESTQSSTESEKKSKLRPLFVDGVFTLWFRQTRLRYFTLSCAPSTQKLEKWDLLNRAPNDYSQPVNDTFGWTTVFNVADRLEEAKAGGSIVSTNIRDGDANQIKRDPRRSDKSKATAEPKKKETEFGFDSRGLKSDTSSSRRALGAAPLRAHPDPFNEKLDESMRNDALRNLQEMPIERVAQLFPEYVPSVHEQPEMTVLSMCILDEASSATIESSKARLLNWIKLLESHNPSLRDLHVVFRLHEAQDEDVNDSRSDSKSDENALSTAERSAKLDEREWRT